MSNFIFPILTEVEKRLPFYLVGVGCDYEQEKIYRPKGYPFFQWIQGCQGKGQLILNKKKYIVKKNQGMLLFPDVPHEYHAIGDSWIVYWFTFGGDQVTNLLNTIDIKISGVYTVSNENIILSIIRNALITSISDNYLKGIDCSNIVYEFILTLYKYIHKIDYESVERQQSRLQPVFKYIKENYQNPINIDDMAKVIGVTPQHLCLLFKKGLQIRPFEYLNNFRINRAKDFLLKHPDLRIREIAYKLGYENESYFGSIFKKVEGFSPGKFRELHGIYEK